VAGAFIPLVLWLVWSASKRIQDKLYKKKWRDMR
jgi:hypothetical protein